MIVSDKEKLVLFDIDYTLYDTDVFKQSGLKTHQLYTEVKNVLDELSSVAVLGIFSEGDTSLQQQKITASGIEQYFPKEHVHIVLSKNAVIGTIFQPYRDKTVYLVDDKLPVLRLLKQHMPSCTTIWIKRGIYALQQEPFADFTPDVTVDTLEKVPEVVRGGTN